MKYLVIIALTLITLSVTAQKYTRLDKPQQGEIVNVLNTLVFCDTDTITIESIGKTQMLSDGSGYFISVTVNPVTINFKYFGTLVNCYNFQDSTRTIHIIGVNTPQLFYNSYKIY